MGMVRFKCRYCGQEVEYPVVRGPVATRNVCCKILCTVRGYVDLLLGRLK